MRLFSTPTESEAKEDNSRVVLDRSKVVLISRNKKIQVDVKNVLMMHNISNIVQRESAVNEYLDDQDTKDAGWMILDIEDESDINTINEITSLIVPYDVYYVLIGNTDSIAFAKSLEKSGGRYLYISTQLNELPNVILKSQIQITDKSTLRISVLGCKGGCGTTTVSHEILTTLNNFTTAPCLLVQGATGSKDFDLISGNEVDASDSKVQKIADNRSIKMEPISEVFNYTDPVFNHFNIALFEHNACAISTENLELIFKNSNTLVLILGRNFSSFRTAKRVLDEYARFERQKNDAIKRKIIICINEYNAADNKQKFSDEDISEYLGQEISAILPHFQNRKENDSFSQHAHQLSAAILGREKAVLPQSKKSLDLSRLLNLFSKK
ncbi:hypothetical protein C3432_07830 [Citrobacter amalonaticus]|uniref:Flp pilus assembly protein, ATPase CpaE n=1 Tax=Citrobacter amalonaticus TaxID=35703 RepID=A0A2S4RY52_CITAM|nr:hypothetical protein [Citrobacter amalonaticus]POT57843.1 hypothetical protein C3432_07830 [Citrobacter amalonaticus]POT76630.1 hypothetical protein C3436_03995 [Citrobacter amalonaticus]POU65709.1 hypothetical protein C3430_10410 [Citrobacter amalonaticus]POV05866.1 hypothetical protein C3424_11295 [Citrobacter amalonaticus]